MAALVRNGQLCRQCSAECLDKISEDEPAEIECPMCNAYGCEHCDEGHFKLTICARKYVDNSLARAINMTTYADKGIMPVGGGLLDQSAWFIDLWSTITDEENTIDRERQERR